MAIGTKKEAYILAEHTIYILLLKIKETTLMKIASFTVSQLVNL